MALGPSISSHEIALVNMQTYCTLYVKSNKQEIKYINHCKYPDYVNLLQLIYPPIVPI